MSSPDYLNALLETILDQLNQGNNDKNPKNTKCKNQQFTLSPTQALVILGLFTGVFEVNSVLVHRDQHIDVLLVGSLKRKTEMDKILDKMGSMTFDEVMRALLARFG